MTAMMVLRQSRPTAIFDLLENDALLKELSVSTGDAVQLKKLATEYKVMARENAGALPNLQGIAVAEAVQSFQKLAESEAATKEKLLPRLKAMLTAKQFNRLQQIHWQVLGAMALSESEMIEALPIAQAQQDQIMAISAEYEGKQTELIKSVTEFPTAAMSARLWRSSLAVRKLARIEQRTRVEAWKQC